MDTAAEVMPEVASRATEVAAAAAAMHGPGTLQKKLPLLPPDHHPPLTFSFVFNGEEDQLM